MVNWMCLNLMHCHVSERKRQLGSLAVCCKSYCKCGECGTKSVHFPVGVTLLPRHNTAFSQRKRCVLVSVWCLTWAKYLIRRPAPALNWNFLLCNTVTVQNWQSPQLHEEVACEMILAHFFNGPLFSCRFHFCTSAFVSQDLNLILISCFSSDVSYCFD